MGVLARELTARLCDSLPRGFNALPVVVGAVALLRLARHWRAPSVRALRRFRRRTGSPLPP